MKSNPQQIFENLVGGAIRKLKDYYAASGNKEALDKLNESLKTDRVSKELDANRYFYLFELMCETRQPSLAEDALSCINSLIAERFLNVVGDVALQNSLLSILQKSLLRLPEQAASILVQIRSPRLEVLQLMFQTYPLCLEPTQQRLATAALSIVARIFSFRDKELSSFTYKVYQLFKPLVTVIPDYELTTEQQQRQILGYYVGKVIGEVVTKVELALSDGQIAKGKFGLCFMCRAPADFYCKDTKVSVCSADCKKNHLEEEGKVSWLAVRHSDEEKKLFEEFLRKRSQDRSQSVSARLLALQFSIEVLLNSNYKPRVPLELISEPAVGVAELKKLQCLYAYFYFEQREELCEHVFYEFLLHSDQQSDYRLLAEAFFKTLFSDDRLYLTYFNFDLQRNKISIIRDIVAKYSKLQNRSMLETLINNVYAQNLKRFPDEQYEFVQQQHQIVKAFNGNTEKGCEILRKVYPEDGRQNSIATFFRKNEKSLSRERLGEFFARNNSESQTVLLRFLELLDLKSLEIDEAVREVFYHFSVSESQQIYRIIEVFSKVYSSPKLLKPEDLFQFAYFILMLQTELHSPAIEKRTTLEGMLGRVKSFSPSLAANIQYLSQIYYNIRARPFSKTEKKVRYGYFQRHEKLAVGSYSKSLVLLHNWHPLYNWLSAENSFASKELIYRVCSVLIREQVAPYFLHLLTRELSRVDMLSRDVTQEEVFLVSSVLTLLWQQPNHVKGEWRQVLGMMAQYRTLLEKVNAKRVQNQAANHQDANHQKLRLYLSEGQISRLFQSTRDFNAQSLQLFAAALSTIPDSCFMSDLPILLELNYTHIDIFWDSLLTYASLQKVQQQVHVLTELLVMLSALVIARKEDQALQKQLLVRAVSIMKTVAQTPCLFLYSASIAARLLTESQFDLHSELWEAVISSTVRMPLQHKLELAKFLQTSNTKMYEDLVVKILLNSEDIDFLAHNLDLVRSRPELFEPHLSGLQNRTFTKLFILPQYKNYILAHLVEFGATPELCKLLSSEIAGMSVEQLEAIHSFVVDHMKQTEPEFINLAVMLLTTVQEAKAVETVAKLMEQCQNQFPAVVREIRLGVEDKLTEAQSSFKLNYVLVVKKTVTQLSLLKAIEEVHRRLSLECLKALLPLMEQAVKSSRSFNRNIVLRWQLWRDGLLKELKQLPGLMKKERSSQLLTLSILELISKKSGNYDRLVSYSAALLKDTSERLSLYIQHYKYYRNCQKEDLNYYFFSEIEREVVDIRKLASRIPADLEKVEWSDVSRQARKELIRATAGALRVGLYKFRQAGLALEITQEDDRLTELHQRILDSL